MYCLNAVGRGEGVKKGLKSAVILKVSPLAGKTYSERSKFASSSYQNTFYNRQLIAPFKSWQSRHFHAMPPGVSHFIILSIVCGAICSDKSGARVFYSLHTSSSRRCMGLLWNIEHLNLLLYQRRHMETRPKRSGFIILNFIQANERAKRACIILRNCKSRNYPLLTLVSYSTYDIYLHWGYRNKYRKLCRLTN